MIPNISTLLVVYIFGGLTLLPVLIFTFWVYSYYTLPRSPIEKGKLKYNAGQEFEWEKGSETVVNEDHDSRCPIQDNNSVAAYFTVCRDFFPGGVSHRTPERSTIPGSTISNESFNVYQSMYRSIFDRSKSQIPNIDGGVPTGKPSKKDRNVFLIILRYVINYRSQIFEALMILDMVI